MELTAESKGLLEKAIAYGKQSSKGIIILSLIDIITGILSIFIVALTIPAIAASVAVLFKVTKTAINYNKLRSAAMAVSPAVAGYIAVRKKNKSYLTRVKKTIVGGLDKMKFIKKVLTFLWGNKLTTSMIAVSAVAAYGAYIASPFAFAYNVAIGAVVFVLATIVAVKIGGEKLQAIVDRLASQFLTKEQQTELKQVETKAKAIAKEKAKIDKLAEIKKAKQAKERAEKSEADRIQVLVDQRLAEMAEQPVKTIDKVQ